MSMLNDQGEQLDRVEGHLDKINADMKDADKALTGMEKWCGLFVCPWNRWCGNCVGYEELMPNIYQDAIRSN